MTSSAAQLCASVSRSISGRKKTWEGGQLASRQATPNRLFHHGESTAGSATRALSPPHPERGVQTVAFGEGVLSLDPALSLVEDHDCGMARLSVRVRPALGAGSGFRSRSSEQQRRTRSRWRSPQVREMTSEFQARPACSLPRRVDAGEP